MQFSKIFVAAVAAATSVYAAPLPSVPGAVAGAIGVACAFQPDKCQKVGDAVVNTAHDVASASGSRQKEAGSSGVIGSTLANAMSGGLAHGFKKL